jgi:curved DNA-binding protein
MLILSAKQLFFGLRALSSINMAQRDLYETLGVPRTATPKDIRSAYRDLARKYHPDRNQGNKQAEERFKEASYARDILLNEGKRKLYDEFGDVGLREGFNADAYRQYRHAGERGAGAGGTGGFGGFSGLEDLFSQVGGRGGAWSGSIDDLFNRGAAEAPFGGRGGRRARSRGHDVTSEVTIGFAEAVRGTERELVLQAAGEEARSIKVRIPPGVADGGRVRLRGQGQDGGDLVLQIHVEEHPNFKREGLDLLLELPISVGEAYHGAKIAVPTPEGSVTLRVPAKVRGGSRLRLRERGVRQGSKVGDLIVQVQIALPDADDIGPTIDTLEASYKEPVRKEIVL